MKRSGNALVTTLSILLIVAALVVGTSYTTQIQSWMTRNDTTSTGANYIAQAGLQKYKTAAFQSFRFYLNNLETYGIDLATYAKCGNLLTIGIDLNRDGVLDNNDLLPGGSLTEQIDLGNGLVGTYTITYRSSGAKIILESVGTYASAKSTARVVLQAENAGIFTYGIAAGGGGSNSRWINGNTSVWGSVYIQGSASQPNAAVISSNGSFAMQNSYNQATLQAETGLSASTIGQFLNLNTLQQDDLCARLRVASGRVEFTGSTQVGTATSPLAGINVDGGTTNSSLNTSTGAYEGSNCVGGNASMDICLGGSAKAYAKELKGLDLAPPPDFPDLTDQCRTNTSLTWAGCLQSSAVLTVVRASNGDITSSPAMTCYKRVSAGSTLWSTTPTPFANLITMVSGSPTLLFDDNSTSFKCSINTVSGPVDVLVYDYNDNNSNPETNNAGALTIGNVAFPNSLVNFRGFDLEFQRNVQVRYTGKASMFVQANAGNGGDIIVDGDILPSNSFPDQDILGLIAEDTLVFTGANQNQLLTNSQVAVGMFYAGNLIEARGSKTAILGGMYSNSFLLGNGSAASVIQVPGLEYNLAPGFESAKNDIVPTFRVLSYERR